MKNFFYTESIQFEDPGVKYINYLSKKIYGIAKYAEYIFEKLKIDSKIESIESLVVNYNQESKTREYNSDIDLLVLVFNETIRKTKSASEQLQLDFSVEELDIEKEYFTATVADTLKPLVKDLLRFIDGELRLKIKR